MANTRGRASATTRDVLEPPSPTDVLQAQVMMQRSTVNASGTRPSKRTCGVPVTGHVVGGTGVTNNQGMWSITYSRILCGIGDPHNPTLNAQRPIVVATARGERPIVVTTSVTEDSSAPDYTITIRTFRLDGAPAARANFAWHAMSLTRSTIL
jgi:hypothetical protein